MSVCDVVGVQLASTTTNFAYVLVTFEHYSVEFFSPLLVKLFSAHTSVLNYGFGLVYQSLTGLVSDIRGLKLVSPAGLVPTSLFLWLTLSLPMLG